MTETQTHQLAAVGPDQGGLTYSWVCSCGSRGRVTGDSACSTATYEAAKAGHARHVLDPQPG